MSKLPTIIEEADIGEPSEWLHNPHAGEMLLSEFITPLALSVQQLAGVLDIAAERLIDTIEGRRRMDAELDLRLSRYFRMTPGFFLDLQTSYELLEAKRSLRGRLDHIKPRPRRVA